MSKWSEFYKQRVNSTYQEYFEQRYKPMIDTILSLNECNLIREEGIGIGSLSKAILKDTRVSRVCSGFDSCESMIQLTKENLGDTFPVYRDNILHPSRRTSYDLAITHGVLEHFNNYQIGCILNRHKAFHKRHIHYVPTNGYDTPSFGDERLLPVKDWLNLTKPKDYILFNDRCDLLLIF